MACSKPVLPSVAYTPISENEMLLEIIFNKFSPSSFLKNLTSVREVNRKFNRVAIKCIQQRTWASRTFLRLSTDEDLKDYLGTFTPSPGNCLFSCYRIERVDPKKFETSANFQEKLLVKFFKTFGSRVKSLSITPNLSPQLIKNVDTYLGNMGDSLHELRILIPREVYVGCMFPYSKKKFRPSQANYSLQNLSYLCLTFELVDTAEPGIIITHHNNMLENILNKIPIGKSVKICLMQWESIDQMLDLLEKYGQIENLKILDTHETRPEDLTALCAAAAGGQLQLQHLGVENWKYDNRFVMAEAMHEFLTARANTLEILDLSNIGKFFKFPPEMKALRKLKMTVLPAYGNVEEGNQQIDAQLVGNFRPIVYELMFPKLEELELLSLKHYNQDNGFNSIFEPLFLAEQLPCATLRKLRIFDLKISEGFLRRLSTTFPRIESLEIWHDEGNPEFNNQRDFYSILWNDVNFASNLRELSIIIHFSPSKNGKRGEFELDSLFSGVCEQKIKSLRTPPTANLQELLLSLHEPADSSILNLTNLKKLCIYNAAHTCDQYGHFTDFSIFYIFEKMRNLEFIHMERSLRKFSRGALDYLKSKLTRNSMEPTIRRCSTVEERLERVFRTGLTFTGAVDECLFSYNLIKDGVPDPDDEDEDEDELPSANTTANPDRPIYFTVGR